MTCNLFQFHNFFDQNGRPLSNGTLTFLDQTTQEPLPVYDGPTGETSYGNVIDLTDAGSVLRLIWLDSSYAYTCIIKDSEGSVIDTWSNLLSLSTINTVPGEANTTNAATVADLNKEGQTGDVKFIDGYYSPFDGGGGIFMWDAGSTEAEDKGTVFKPSSTSASNPGRWRRVFNTPYVISAWFGAIPRNDESTGKLKDLTPDFVRINSYMSRSHAVNTLYVYHASSATTRYTINTSLNLSNVTKLIFIRNAFFFIGEGVTLSIQNADIEGREVEHISSNTKNCTVNFKDDIALRWTWIRYLFQENGSDTNQTNTYIVSQLPDYTKLTIDRDVTFTSTSTIYIEKPYMEMYVVGNADFEEEGSRNPSGYTYFTIGKYSSDHQGSIIGLGSAKHSDYPFSGDGLDKSSNYYPSEACYRDCIGYNTIVHWDGGDDSKWPELTSPYASYNLNTLILDKNFSPSKLFYCTDLQSAARANRNVVSRTIKLSQYQNATEAILAWINARSDSFGSGIRNQSNWLFCEGAAFSLKNDQIPSGSTLAFSEAVITGDVGSSSNIMNYVGLDQSVIQGVTYANHIRLEASVIGRMSSGNSGPIKSLVAKAGSSFGDVSEITEGLDMNDASGGTISKVTNCQCNIRNSSLHYLYNYGSSMIFINNSYIGQHDWDPVNNVAPNNVIITNNNIVIYNYWDNSTFLTSNCENVVISGNTIVPDNTSSQWSVPMAAVGADATVVATNSSSMGQCTDVVIYKSGNDGWWSYDSTASFQTCNMSRSSSTSNDWTISSLSAKMKIDQNWGTTETKTFTMDPNVTFTLTGSYNTTDGYWYFEAVRTGSGANYGIKMTWNGDDYYWGLKKFKVKSSSDGLQEIRIDCNNANILVLGENRVGSNKGSLSKKAYACIGLDISDDWTDMYNLGVSNAVLGFNDSSDFNGWSQYGSMYETVAAGYAASGKYVEGTLSWNHGSATGPRKRHKGMFKLDSNGQIVFTNGPFYNVKFVCHGINPYK